MVSNVVYTDYCVCVRPFLTASNDKIKIPQKSYSYQGDGSDDWSRYMCIYILYILDIGWANCVVKISYGS